MLMLHEPRVITKKNLRGDQDTFSSRRAQKLIRVLYIINDLSIGGAEMMLYKLLAESDRERFEPVVMEESPDAVMVVGDVNSTIACALTSVKLGIPVAHVEAGLPLVGCRRS